MNGQIYCSGNLVPELDISWSFSDSQDPRCDSCAILLFAVHTGGGLLSCWSVSLGLSVGLNELNLFTHSTSALVYFECKMSTGIFNVWNLSSVFAPIFAQTSPPPLRIYCGFDLCCLKPLKSFQRSRAVFFLFFLLFLFSFRNTLVPGVDIVCYSAWSKHSTPV